MANGVFNDLTAVRHLRAPKLLTDTGKVLLQTYAGTTFDMLQFGGTTASYPALKRSGNTIQIRNADDSGYADVTARNIIATNTLELTTAATGIILKSANGTRYTVTVTNGGSLTVTAV